MPNVCHLSHIKSLADIILTTFLSFFPWKSFQIQQILQHCYKYLQIKSCMNKVVFLSVSYLGLVIVFQWLHQVTITYINLLIFTNFLHLSFLILFTMFCNMLSQFLLQFCWPSLLLIFVVNTYIFCHCGYLNCRRVPDRPRDPAKWDEIADVVAALSIPVIANGDVFEYEDFERIKGATGSKKCLLIHLCSSVLMMQKQS